MRALFGLGVRRPFGRRMCQLAVVSSLNSVLATHPHSLTIHFPCTGNEVSYV